MPRILPVDTDEKIMLEAMRQAVQNGGIKNVSARTIGQAIGVTDNAIFRHFGSIDKLWKKTYIMCVERGFKEYFAESLAGKIVDVLDMYRFLVDYYWNWTDAATFIVLAKPAIGFSPTKIGDNNHYYIDEMKRLMKGHTLNNLEAGFLWEFVVVMALKYVVRSASGEFDNIDGAEQISEDIVFGKYFRHIK